MSNVELERTPNKQAYMALRRQHGFKPFDKMHPLAQAIIKGWKKNSPIDSLVLSSELELLGRLPINELPYRDAAQHYLMFLKESLARKLPGLSEDASESQSTDWGDLLESGAVAVDGVNVVLTDEKPEQEILSIFRTPESGYQDYTVIEIDTTAFKDGGMLIIDISVGNAEPMGSFDLYDGKTELPTAGMPKSALTSAWDVPPGKRGTIKYRFDRGKVFKLGGLAVGSVRKGASTLFSLQFPWNLCQQKTTKINSTLL